MAMKFTVQIICDKCGGVYDWGDHETVAIQMISPTLPDGWMLASDGERGLTLCSPCGRLWSRYIERFLDNDQPAWNNS